MCDPNSCLPVSAFSLLKLLIFGVFLCFNMATMPGRIKNTFRSLPDSWMWLCDCSGQ